MTLDTLARNRQHNREYYGFGPSAMKKLKACSQCGSPASADKHFCVDCGHRLPSKTLYDQYLERHESCLVCSTILTNDMEFCPQCGTKRLRQHSEPI